MRSQILNGRLITRRSREKALAPTSKPPSFNFTVGISITGFSGSFTWNKQLPLKEQLRGTAHQLIEHGAKGLGMHKKKRGHHPFAQHPIKKLR
jgi:hypothetical protein